MDKVYKSQKGVLHGLIIWVPTFLLTIITVVRILGIFEILNVIPIPFILVGNIAFLIHSTTVWFMTEYQIKEGDLKIRFGVFKFETIKIDSIVQIDQTSLGNRSPSLSFDRLRLKRQKEQDIVISPENKENFIKDLLQINASIKVMLKEE